MPNIALDTFNSLRGLICVYKPPDTSFKYIQWKLKSNICADLNQLDTRPPRKYLEINRSGSEVSINVKPSYADNVLCSGPKFENHHLSMTVASGLSNLASGVLVIGINEQHEVMKLLKKLNFTKCYHLKGILGQATSNFHINERVVAKAKYEKVTDSKFAKVLASYQSATQRKMFEEYGMQLDTQEAYNFAVKGLYRPWFRGPPITYSLNLVSFNPPEFTIEVQCIHETESYLLHLIHNLGLNLRCYATCTGIRCLRYGCFHVEHALVKGQWNLNEISNNVKLCWGILEDNYKDKIQFSRTVETSKVSPHRTEEIRDMKISSKPFLESKNWQH